MIQRYRKASLKSMHHLLPESAIFMGVIGGAGRGRTADKGFADLCLTTWRPLLRRVHSTREKTRHHPLRKENAGPHVDVHGKTVRGKSPQSPLALRTHFSAPCMAINN